MSNLNLLQNRITPDEFLAWEANQTDRHEYLDGVVTAMSGASLDHNRIVTNLARETSTALLGTPCEALTTSQMVQVEAVTAFFYPDVFLVCDDLRMGKQQSILNPKIIFEVLSPSTGRRDRYEKFRAYQTIESLQEYFLVHQDTAQIEAYRRQPDGTWNPNVYTVYVGLGTTLVLESMGIGVPLRMIYYRVELPDAEALSQETERL